jgi:hypothetical protein
LHKGGPFFYPKFKNMVYIVKFKDGIENDYYLTREHSAGEYSLFSLNFHKTGEMLISNSDRTFKANDLQKIYIVFAAADLSQLMSFFAQQNIKCLMSGVIDEEQAAIFQSYVMRKKSNIINLA